MIGLEIIHVRPQKSNGYPPLLFVHGAFHAAWCWEEHFLPFFLEHGFECLAPSLRGHGRSRLVDLRKVRFRDYVADISQVGKLLPTPPLLIGHSMGSVVAQGYAQHHPVAGLVLLTPMCAIPGEHGLQALWHIAKHHLVPFLEMQFLKWPQALVKTLERTRRSFFSKEMPEAKVKEYYHRFQDESIPVIQQITRRKLFTQPIRKGFPCLVLEAEQDTIVHPSDIDLLTTLYQAKKEKVPKIAHDVMLDAHWEQAAERILQWIKNTYSRKFI